ncbi:MAG: hypothetical protein SAK42_05245 [Oscillatoria sp. PMC 1076.18]|nr:hypothetical protein [Oscillatoria sp. PMC 1076.18]
MSLFYLKLFHREPDYSEQAKPSLFTNSEPSLGNLETQAGAYKLQIKVAEKHQKIRQIYCWERRFLL